ncbi:MAG: TonB family protein [Opitutales bacterium]
MIVSKVSLLSSLSLIAASLAFGASTQSDLTVRSAPLEVIDRVAPASMPASVDKRTGDKEARVVLACTIQPDGKATHIAVVKAASADLIEPAVKALESWTFKPRKVDGETVATRVLVPFRYLPTGSERVPGAVVAGKE